MHKYCLIIVILLATKAASGQNYLQKCLSKQVSPLKTNLLCLTYTETVNELEHSFQPWQQTRFNGSGQVWYNSAAFLKQDSLVSGRRVYRSATQYNGKDLLFRDYGSKGLSAVTKDMLADMPFTNARYTPAQLLEYFAEHNIPISNTKGVFAVYKTTINKTIITLYIDKKDNHLAKATTLNDDELFGDVETSFIYYDYATVNYVSYPQKIAVGKINGKIKDSVTISVANIVPDTVQLLTKPADYTITEKAQKTPEISTEKHSDHIYFISLKHTNDKVLVAEFEDFLLVAEAPLSSENGELIVKETKRIAPGKPIRYFVFGHYHPHYIGGVRAFVQQGAKIICSSEDSAYVAYLTSAPHTLHPDSLQLKPKPLQTMNITDSLYIADKTNQVRIYHLGAQSAHTKDYLVYYFPKEKLLFEDDLLYIPKTGPVQKAWQGQVALYKAITDMGVQVNTIIQSWPAESEYSKSVIPFADLEASVKMNK